MPPTSPSHDDALDLDGLDVKPSGAKKAAAAESDFEKELEALFAEELASSDEKPATAPPVGAPEPEEEALLLDDLVEDAPAVPLAAPATAALEDEDILDLSAFGEGGELELSPPDDTAGGKDGVIDLSGLDEIISGLGDAKAAPAPAAEPAPLEPAPLDGTDMADLLENLDIPAAAPAVVGEPAAEAGDDLLELSLGDLVEETPAAEPIELEAPAAPEDSILDLTLPDLSDPEPGRDLVAEQEHADLGGELNLSLDDLAAAEPAPDAASVDQMLGDDLGMGGLMEGIESSDGEPAPEISLDAEQLLAQIPDATLEAAMAAAIPPVSVPEETLGESALLEPEAPEFEMLAPEAAEPEPELLAPIAPEEELPETPLPAAEPEEPAPTAVPSALADAALAGAVAGAVTAAASAPVASPVMDDAALAALNERLAQLATQVTGNSVAVVRLEGKLAEREKNLAELEERLKVSQEEAQALRDELSALRSNMEESLRTQDEAVQQELAQSAQAAADKSQAAMEKALGAVDKALGALDKAQMAADKADSLAPRVESAEMTVRGVGARLTQMENRQSQLDREVFAEISRAVPREAAKVIREEIAHLAASMRDE